MKEEMTEAVGTIDDGGPAMGALDYIGLSVTSDRGDYWKWRETVNGVHGAGGFCVTREWVWPDGKTARTDYPNLDTAESAELAKRIDAARKATSQPR